MYHISTLLLREFRLQCDGRIHADNACFDGSGRSRCGRGPVSRQDGDSGAFLNRNGRAGVQSEAGSHGIGMGPSLNRCHLQRLLADRLIVLDTEL